MSDKYCVLQDDTKDCGVSCLLSIIKYYGGYVPKEYLKELTKTNKNGVNALNLVRAARKIGFDSYGIKGRLKDIKQEYLPIIAHVLIEKKYQHFAVIYKIDKKNNRLLIMDPSKGYNYLSLKDFINVSTNYYILLKVKQLIPKLEENKNIISLIMVFLKKYQVVLYSIILISFFYTFFNIITSYNFQLLFNSLNINHDLKIISLFLIFIIIFKTFLNYFRGNLINYVNYLLDNTLVKEAFYHIINLPYLYYKNHTNGDLMTRINDLGNIKEMISGLIVSLFVDVSLAVTIIFFMFSIDKVLSVITIISLTIYIIITVISNKVLQKGIKDSLFLTSGVNNYIVESLSSFETIKNLSIQKHIFNNFSEKYHNLNLINMQLIRKMNKENIFKNLVLSISNFLVIYYGILSIQNNSLTVVSLVTYLTLLNYLVEPIKNILDMQLNYLSCKESIRRIKEVFKIPEEKLTLTDKTLKDISGQIDIMHLSYSYDGTNEVIKDVSLCIMKGEKVLIYGDSGCGKSTLMQILTRYLSNEYQGDITIGGYDLKDLDLYTLRNSICYVSQNEYLYTDSIYNNVTLGRKIKYKDFLNMAKNLLLDNIIKNTSSSYNYLIENNGENISGGEKERIIIARCLLKKANIYIFDESFSALDIEMERKILNYIFMLHQDKTIIVISHRKSNCDLYNQKIRAGEDGYVREEN